MQTDIDPEFCNGPLNEFYLQLVDQYKYLFANDPEYAYSASHISPEDLARKMTLALKNGMANKEGKAIKRACRLLGIKYTYKAIHQFLG